MRITRHVCPRNCFDSCSMLAYVSDQGNLIKVAGDTEHTYTNGQLCTKGYSYTQHVYHQDRVIYPMLQTPRYSGNWQRISWDKALHMIAAKIVDIKGKYNSFLPVGLVKGSGNIGMLAPAMEGMLSSLGPITVSAGSLCWAAAQDARTFDFGNVGAPHAEEMEKADYILLWGVNPAMTAIHQMPIIKKVKERGGKVILIDVYETDTAKQADVFIQVRPGGDGGLALAILQQLILMQSMDMEFIANHTYGWEKFSEWVLNTDIRTFIDVSGIDEKTIKKLAEDLSNHKAVAFWLGMGLQRYSNGGQNIRAIHALAAAIGAFKADGLGVFSAHIDHWRPNQVKKYARDLNQNRRLGVSTLAHSIEQCQHPPLKLLWFVLCNPFTQNVGLNSLYKAIADIELVVTTELFLTETAGQSDLVLPATTCFEHWDLISSYWHNYIAINQKAIEPVGESRSEVNIAQSLSAALNSIQPGISPFPTNLSEEEWLEMEVSSWVGEVTDIKSYTDLLSGARKLRRSMGKDTFTTPTSKYQFVAPEAIREGVLEMPILVKPKRPTRAYPFRLLTLHPPETINSQYTNLEWLDCERTQEIIISKKTASKKGITDGEIVIIYNTIGEIYLKAKIKSNLPDDLCLTFARFDLKENPINTLMDIQLCDMGSKTTGFPGVAFHDTFVNFHSIDW